MRMIYLAIFSHSNKPINVLDHDINHFIYSFQAPIKQTSMIHKIHDTISCYPKAIQCFLHDLTNRWPPTCCEQELWPGGGVDQEEGSLHELLSLESYYWQHATVHTNIHISYMRATPRYYCPDPFGPLCIKLTLTGVYNNLDVVNFEIYFKIFASKYVVRECMITDTGLHSSFVNIC